LKEEPRNVRRKKKISFVVPLGVQRRKQAAFNGNNV
jgi:hypothetical protein